VLEKILANVFPDTTEMDKDEAISNYFALSTDALQKSPQFNAAVMAKACFPMSMDSLKIDAADDLNGPG